MHNKNLLCILPVNKTVVSCKIGILEGLVYINIYCISYFIYSGILFMLWLYIILFSSNIASLLALWFNLITLHAFYDYNRLPSLV